MTDENEPMPVDSPPLAAAIAITLLLVGLLALAVFLFGDEAAAGPNQLAILLCAVVAAITARARGISWENIREGVQEGTAVAVPAIFILLAVGSLIGTWAMCGTIVAMIYYGFEVIDLNYFYVSTCAISALLALGIGSSWTVAGTLGVGLIGIAQGLGLSLPITAGAIISGAYFGDKSSPLSDAANLAAAVAESDIFRHVRHALWTSVPALIVALVVFTYLDRMEMAPVDAAHVAVVQHTLSEAFNVSPWALTPIFVVLALVLARQPAYIAISFGALSGGIVAVILQPDVTLQFVGDREIPVWLAMVEGVWRALSDGFTIQTGIAPLDSLLSRGGMASMMDTVWLVLSALAFGAIMERGGMIGALLRPLLEFAKSTGRLFLTVIASCFGANVLTADQYIAISLPGRVFSHEFRDRGLAPENLSRLLGDSATVTSALVPWNTCGAYLAATLGVATVSYLPFAFFNLVNPLIALLFGLIGLGISRVAAQRPSGGDEIRKSGMSSEGDGQ